MVPASVILSRQEGPNQFILIVFSGKDYFEIDWVRRKLRNMNRKLFFCCCCC